MLGYFASISLRNFVGIGLPCKSLYIVITYYTTNNKDSRLKALKSLSSGCVQTNDEFVWREFEFEIALGKDDFYKGEILVEIHSKCFVKNKLIGSVHLSIKDDLMHDHQFNKSYIPFTLNGHARMVDRNITSSVIYPLKKNYIRRAGGRLEYFVGITGFRLTKHIFSTKDIQYMSSVIASIRMFLSVLSELSVTRMADMICVDTEAIDMYIVNDFYGSIKDVLKKSKTLVDSFEMMLTYKSCNQDFNLNVEMSKHSELEEFVKVKKLVIAELSRTGSFLSDPRDSSICKK